jgi:hypothetical protein
MGIFQITSLHLISLCARPSPHCTNPVAIAVHFYYGILALLKTMGDRTQVTAFMR